MRIRSALTLGAAIAVIGGPALAQSQASHAPMPEVSTYLYGKDFWRGAPQDIQQRLDWLDARLTRGEQDGSITRMEARRAERSVRTARKVYAQLMRRDRGHLSRRDERYMMLRLNNVSSQVRWARTNGVDQRPAYRR